MSFFGNAWLFGSGLSTRPGKNGLVGDGCGRADVEDVRAVAAVDVSGSATMFVVPLHELLRSNSKSFWPGDLVEFMGKPVVSCTGDSHGRGNWSPEVPLAGCLTAVFRVDVNWAAGPDAADKLLSGWTTVVLCDGTRPAEGWPYGPVR